MREILLDLLQRRPFRPFRVHLTCGAVHEVREPELARVTPFTLRLGRFDPPGAHATGLADATGLAPPPAVVDHYIISLDHVVALEPLDADEPVVVPAGHPE